MQFPNILSKKFLQGRCTPMYRPWKMIVYTTVIVMLILFLAQLSTNDLYANLLLTCMFGAVIVVIEVIQFYLLPHIFRAWFAPDSWTNGKDIISTFLMIMGIACAEYCLCLLLGMPFRWKNALYFFGIFILITPFPTIFSVLWNNNLHLQHNLKLANELNEQLLRKQQSEEEQPQNDTPISIPDGKNDTFLLSPTTLLYIEADGNYVKIVYLLDAKPSSKMVRLTLKTMQDLLQESAFIVPCHRSFLVNMNRVSIVTGNSQECYIHFKGLSDTVPVSRNYRKEILKNGK